jgi:excisionase family DNA binding protein|tara:strand:+ start:8413 stop:8598 length:186 start_codon:yes stop_codon:yes gene_type:complete
MPEMILYTPKEVSEILKISYRSVLTLIRDDEIKAIVVPGGYRVRERDLEDYFTYSKANNDN